MLMIDEIEYIHHIPPLVQEHWKLNRINVAWHNFATCTVYCTLWLWQLWVSQIAMSHPKDVENKAYNRNILTVEISNRMWFAMKSKDMAILYHMCSLCNIK